MPSDEAYQAVLAELTRLGDAWRVHREVVNRAIGMLADEVFRYDKRLKDDEDERRRRQAEVDQALATIQRGQDAIRRWQWVRLGVEVGAILIVLAFYLGVRL